MKSLMTSHEIDVEQGDPPKRGFSQAVKGHAVAILGEFIGTFFFLLFGFAGVLNAQIDVANGQATTEDYMYIALSFGLSLLVNAWTFFRVSGGLFNPAVTWGMCLIGAISWTRGALLFLAQMAGGLSAAGMVRALYPSDVGLRTMLNEASVTQGLFIEMFLTMQLVLAIFLLAAAQHKATHLAPIGIGLALFLAHLAGMRYTGASMNPIRSFGPAVVAHTFSTYDWLYWVGPILGSSLAAGIYKLVIFLEYETVNPPNDLDKSQRAGLVSGSESD